MDNKQNPFDYLHYMEKIFCVSNEEIIRLQNKILLLKGF